MAERNISWTGPTKFTDGKPYGKNEHGGYEIEVNGQPAVAIPLGWETDNTYAFPLKDLPNVKQGDNTARMRTVAANGQVSEWTGAVNFPYASTPFPPAALAVD